MELPLVAVDIGGSKVDILYYDGENIRFKRIEKGIKHHELSSKEFKARFNDLINLLSEYEGYYVFSVAGLDSREDRDLWKDLLDTSLKGEYVLVHDVKASLYAATLGEEGIIVIAGTGCNVYGECGDKYAYAGDWGWRLGDDFSGYRLGRDFLNYILRMYDGRIRKNRTYYHFLNFLGVDEDRLINYLYSLSVESIASLTRFVCLYVYEDHYIMRMMKRLVKEALRAVKAVSRNLGCEKLVVHRSGGIFKCETFNELFLSGVFDLGFINGEYVEYPVIGALIIGLKSLNFDKNELENIKNRLQAYLSESSV